MNETATGTIVWADLTVPDAQRVREFYSAVVGWRSEPVTMGAYDDFNMLSEAGLPVTGVCHARGANAHLPPQWLIYVTVADLDRSVTRCLELGGQLLDGPRSMGEKRFCVIRDPAGAVMGLIA